MRVDGVWYRTIWLEDDATVRIIDQRQLPHEFVIEDIRTVQDMATAIKDMHLRGAGLIGCAAAYGMYLAAREAQAATANEDNGTSVQRFRELLSKAGALLTATRPTAVNLRVGVERVETATFARLDGREGIEASVKAAKDMAAAVTDEDAEFCTLA